MKTLKNDKSFLLSDDLMGTNANAGYFTLEGQYSVSLPSPINHEKVVMYDQSINRINDMVKYLVGEECSNVHSVYTYYHTEDADDIDHEVITETPNSVRSLGWLTLTFTPLDTTIDPETFDLFDENTYDIYRGVTTGIDDDDTATSGVTIEYVYEMSITTGDVFEVVDLLNGLANTGEGYWIWNLVNHPNEVDLENPKDNEKRHMTKRIWHMKHDKHSNAYGVLNGQLPDLKPPSE